MVPRFNARLTFLIPLATFLSLACGSSTAPSPASVKQAFTSSAATSSTSNFAVLANAAATCTDGKITGDVGTFQATPPGAITLTNCPLTGTTHIGDAASIAAYQAFLSAYAALAPKSTDVCPIITGTLDGMNLAPGVYCVSAEAKTGVLTLTGSANATWTFKVAPGAFTGTSFTVLMAGGAQPCNVTWWVDMASTMTDSNLKGNILAGAAITLTRGTLAGDAFAGAAGVGDVTITGTVVTGCAGIGGPGSCGGEDQEKCKCGEGKRHHEGDTAKRGDDEGDHGDDCDDGEGDHGDGDGHGGDHNHGHERD